LNRGDHDFQLGGIRIVLYCPVREMPTNSPKTRLWRKWIVH
jgi:hypothetical protein